MASDDEEKLLEKMYDLEGGPRKPKPVYDSQIVGALVGIVDAGARLLDTEPKGQTAYDHQEVLWRDLEQARAIVNTEIRRRKRAQKEFRG